MYLTSLDDLLEILPPALTSLLLPSPLGLIFSTGILERMLIQC
jgi:hypothetical protein